MPRYANIERKFTYLQTKGLKIMLGGTGWKRFVSGGR